MEYTILIPLISFLGIGLVLKDFLSAIIARIHIKVTNDLEIGDRIKIGDIKGDILEIGIFRTRLLEIGDGKRLPSSATGRIIYIPNSMLLFTPLVRYAVEGKIVDSVTIFLESDSEVEDAKNILKDILLLKTKATKDLPDVDVYFTEDKIQLIGKYEVSNMKEMPKIRTEVLCEFLKKARENKNIKLHQK